MTYYCSCGAVLRGNGAKGSHRKKHERIGNWEPRSSMRALNPSVFGLLTLDQFRAKFPDVDIRGGNP